MSKISAANQHTSDEREQVFWDLYVALLSTGIDNAYQCAIKAGYSQSHSENITLQGWFKERKSKLRRKGMLDKSERNLEKVLDTPWEDEQGKLATDVMKIVVDVSKTIVTTLGKDEGYSTRSELTGKDGADLIPDKQSKEKADEALDAYFNGQDKGNTEIGEPEGTVSTV
jgi:phage terminase small subunit